ncbi:zinc finger protein 32-like [Drosophila erecta]|uniref:zinc finger protein 32-like n=1 Tax=Drosophila erecta TaxID=7220 RepID=UPI0001780D5C|nr:zinc finger protein 32-like [Drosophila erecta]
MEEICRVCLGNHDNMVNIFEGNPILGPSIPDMIAQWSGYQVTKGDTLPELICLSCLEDAENAFDIQRTAKMGHQFLCQVKKVEKTGEDTCQVSGCESEESSSLHMIIEEPPINEERTRQELHDEQSNGPVHFYLFEDEISVSETDQSNCLNREGAAKQITRSGDDNMNSSNNQHKCPNCPKTFQRKWNLKLHIRTHSGERPYKCTQCPKSFSRTCGLRNHMSTHTTDRAYKCDYCPMSFRFQNSYSRHMRTQHTEFFEKRVRPAKQSLVCSYCSKVCSRPSTLDIHIRIHTRERPFQCPHCPSAYSSNSTLRVHLRIHTGERPYMCSHCSVDFRTRTELRRHIRRHSVKTSFQHPHAESSLATTCYTSG